MKSSSTCHWLPVLFGAGLLLAASADAAVPVSIANAGFENPALAEGTYPSTIPNWSQGSYDTTNPGVWLAGSSDSGHYNISTSEYASGAAAEGEQMAFTTTASGFDAGISQVLAATLQAASEYVLSVKVGNPFVYNQSTTGDWRIELLAGGVLLASATGPSPGDDTGFVTATLTYPSGAAPAQLGQALEIRLLAVDFTLGKQVDFDDVRLSVTLGNPVAVPGGPYFVLLSGGSLVLDGGASLPSDGQSITAYEWDLDNDGSFDEAITGATPAVISSDDLQNVHGMKSGANVILLRVTDSAGKASITATTVTLVEAPVEFYRAGGGAWDTSTANWGMVPGGPYDTMAWSNSAPLTAVLEGGGGTLNLASDINLFGLRITAGTPRILTDNSLHFVSGSILQDNGVNSALNMTIRSGVAGSPPATLTAGEILILDAQEGLPQILGAIALRPRVSGTGDNRLTLQGASTGNSTGDITLTTADNQQRSVLEKRGTGTWTVGALKGAHNQRLRLLMFDTGRLIVSGGDMPGTEFRWESPGAILELRQAGGIDASGSRVRLLQGTLDNTSGGQITFSNFLRVEFGGSGSFTLAGDSLSFGTTRVSLLSANNTVTVEDAASVLTFGGAVTDGGLLTKAGAGTLALTGTVREYTGDTTVEAGTLSIGNGSLASAVTVNDGAALALGVGATVISTSALTLADGSKVRVTGTPTAQSYTLFQATAINGTPVLETTVPGYELVVADGGTTLQLNATGAAPYLSWAAGPFTGTLANPSPSLDFDAGGLETGIEWVTAGDPTDPDDDSAIAPTFDPTTDPDFFIFTYRRNDDAEADTLTAIAVEYGSDLAGWTPAVPGPDIQISVVDDGADEGVDLVAVKLRRTLAAGGRLFVRLKVEVVLP